MRKILITLALLFLLIVLFLPIFTIFHRAFLEGFKVYLENIQNEELLFSIKLTVIVAFTCLPINFLFGVSASFLIAKHKVYGKNFLMILIELPLSISPIVAGLAYLMLFGNYGLIGKYLEPFGIELTFNLIGIVLVTLFVSMSYLVSVLVPLMKSQGLNQEEAALTLGANFWQSFFYITLPNIKWGVVYGLILANARAIGEFGAVSVVSGMIRGETLTLPLQVQSLYFDNNITGAFVASSLLTLLAFFSIGLRHFIGRKAGVS